MFTVILSRRKIHLSDTVVNLLGIQLNKVGVNWRLVVTGGVARWDSAWRPTRLRTLWWLRMSQGKWQLDAKITVQQHRRHCKLCSQTLWQCSHNKWVFFKRCTLPHYEGSNVPRCELWRFWSQFIWMPFLTPPTNGWMVASGNRTQVCWVEVQHRKHRAALLSAALVFPWRDCQVTTPTWRSDALKRLDSLLFLIVTSYFFGFGGHLMRWLGCA